jgi:hypothetical protein
VMIPSATPRWIENETTKSDKYDLGNGSNQSTSGQVEQVKWC